MNLTAALLLDMTLKTALLCLVGFGLAALARRSSAALRHDIWLAVVACAALMPAAMLAFRLSWPEHPIAPVHEAILAAAPALPAGSPAGAIEALDRIWSGNGGVSRSGWIEAALVSIWLIGLAASVLRTLLGYRSACRLVQRAEPLVGVEAPAGVRVLVTPELQAPAQFGFIRPAILLPADALSWPHARLRAVIAHEAAHVARRDCMLELLVQLAAILHWYNPLLLAAAHKMRAERELACDERVVAAGLDARSYAAALVEVARRMNGATQPILMAMARPPELERRVVRLLGATRLAAGDTRLPRALACAAIALILPFAMLTAPAAGLVADGSVQPGAGPLSGLDDPMSERVPLDYERLAAQAAAVPAHGPERAAIAALQAQLDRQSNGYGDLVRERAIWALVQVRNGRLFEPLAQQVRDRDWRVRAYVAWVFGAAEDRRATPLLVQLLDDPVWRVRAMAAAALAGLADPTAADAMIEALDDPAWQVRIAAIEYVDRIGDRELAEHLRTLLRDPHTATRARAEAVHSRF